MTVVGGRELAAALSVEGGSVVSLCRNPNFGHIGASQVRQLSTLSMV